MREIDIRRQRAGVRSAGVSRSGVLIVVLLGLAAGYLLARPRSAAPDDAGLLAAVAQRPDPELTPDEVVRLQMTALGQARDDDAAMAQCYAFASPANRATTGPFANFSRMVRSEYAPLVDHDQVVIGETVLREEFATLLVTVVDAEDQPHVYRFFLSRQTEPPYEECWMTDIVIGGDASPPAPDLDPATST